MSQKERQGYKRGKRGNHCHFLGPNQQDPVLAKGSIVQRVSLMGSLKEKLLQNFPEWLKRFFFFFLHTVVINRTYPFLKASLLPSQIKIHIWPWQHSGHELICHYPAQVLLPRVKINKAYIPFSEKTAEGTWNPFRQHYSSIHFIHSVTTKIIQSRHGPTQSTSEELTPLSLNPRFSVLGTKT